MATRDRFPQEPQLEQHHFTAPEPITQGELFARISLRQLPIMKHGPEDEWIFTTPTMH